MNAPIMPITCGFFTTPAGGSKGRPGAANLRFVTPVATPRIRRSVAYYPIATPSLPVYGGNYYPLPIRAKPIGGVVTQRNQERPRLKSLETRRFDQ